MVLFSRIIEVYGPESSGKTTLTLHTIAEAQKQVRWLVSLCPSVVVALHTLARCVLPP